MLLLCRAEARENAHIGGPSEREDQQQRRRQRQMPAPARSPAFAFAARVGRRQHLGLLRDRAGDQPRPFDEPIGVGGVSAWSSPSRKRSPAAPALSPDRSRLNHFPPSATS